jgi:hypothetical protein
VPIRANKLATSRSSFLTPQELAIIHLNAGSFRPLSGSA